ncbi:MAG: hypothetical protein RBS53_01530 [Bacteroidales bacterium]|jgi:hypothetical protein|nr:hypothetical protein [Bacteroidales bacterium]NLM93216.1 hypothetical protein [Bacteroidales bacterium]
MFRKLIKYITRTWDEHNQPKNPAFRALPPFFYELLAYLILAAVIAWTVSLYLE